MDNLKTSFGIDDTYTKLYRRPTHPDQMTKVKEQIPLVADYNYMADVLYLPTDKFGFNKLLVVCDIADDMFDIEKMKGESAEETLNAFKKMMKRDIIKVPYASLLTDGGSSFKGVFHKYLYENGVNHRVARPGRHHQLSNVDSLCRQLGMVFNGIMNMKEEETGKVSKAWTHAIDEVRGKLNNYRRSRGVKLPKDLTTYEYPIFDNVIPKIKVKKIKVKVKAREGGHLKDDVEDHPTEPMKFTQIKPKYKEGDLVNVLLEEPQTILGKNNQLKILGWVI